ncbi:TetR/AcrR family transcriptional regulator [Actinoplanes sp. NPDC023714]|uniref:TetR/AcrR family transcriptional regulator n=1 Tax=Actinoplanes sp. NPDC023714 TaxID=3154322 RepID=UPI0033E0F72D
MSILVGMVRLTRVEQQARTRSAVLAAAAEEFREHGFAEAKVDRIAARAELTRGAVYSNFPSKRSLYLAVLLEAERPLTPYPAMMDMDGPADAAGEFARAWLDRLPLAGDSPADGRLRSQSLAGVFEDEPGRTAMTETAHLEALLLATVLDHSVRRAALLLTMLHGARDLARSAPGFGDPFDVVAACRHLAAMDVADVWDPPHLPFVRPASPVAEAWSPPEGLLDALTGEPADLTADGLVTVLGSARLSAAEEAVRAAERMPPSEKAQPSIFGPYVSPANTSPANTSPANTSPANTSPANTSPANTSPDRSSPAGSDRVAASGKAGPRQPSVTIAVVTADPAETGALIRLRIAELVGCLRASGAVTAGQGMAGQGTAGQAATFPFRLVIDEEGAVAAAIGAEVGEGTETAVRIRSGEIVARASGRGASYAAAGLVTEGESR